MSSQSLLDKVRLQEAIAASGSSLGLPLELLEQTGSTNDIAAMRATAGAAHGTLILAEQQSSGRGRLGRKWFSPAGQNLYMSLILRPVVPAERLASITLAIGLAVAEGVEPFVSGVPVQVKWPNDVHIAHKKAVGILVEASTSGVGTFQLVAGIGINVLQTSFDPEIADIATSIALHGPAPDRVAVLVCVLGRLSQRIREFEREGIHAMLAELRARDATLGRRVKCVAGEGTGEGIEEDGTLRVRLGTGELVRVQAGDVDLRHG